MANYQMAARTNYFKVKDEAEFAAFVARFEDNGVELSGSIKDGETLQCLLFDEAMPTTNDQDEDIDFFGILSTHLADGWVAIYMESGHEKMCYVTGFARAINNKGEERFISIDNIYDMAKGLGSNVTEAAY